MREGMVMIETVMIPTQCKNQNIPNEQEVVN